MKRPITTEHPAHPTGQSHDDTGHGDRGQDGTGQDDAGQDDVGQDDVGQDKATRSHEGRGGAPAPRPGDDRDGQVWHGAAHTCEGRASDPDEDRGGREGKRGSATPPLRSGHDQSVRRKRGAILGLLAGARSPAIRNHESRASDPGRRGAALGLAFTGDHSRVARTCESPTGDPSQGRTLPTGERRGDERAASKGRSFPGWRRAALGLALAFTLGLAPPAPASAGGSGGTMATAFALYGKGDYAAAAALLFRLAESGHPRARALLGYMSEHGQGVPQDFNRAAWLYGLAAEQGDATAQYLLGLLYDKGRGVPRDVVLSQKWLILATARASRRERDTYTRIRDAVATKMSPAQLALAQQLAVQWIPTNPQPAPMAP